MKTRYIVGGMAATVVAALFVMNASWLVSPPVTAGQLLAHRGMYQRYDREGLTRDTCTATRIKKPTHDFLENTLPSMRAAFDAGADAVEIDVHPTTDGDFAVFHDWTLDCRTDGTGVTREHSLAQLKSLDIGYGYTHDGGRTFPFRGRFKGAMPSLSEVLTTFPDKAFLINIKSNDPREAETLDAWLKRHPEVQPDRLTVFAGERPGKRLAQLRPELKPVSKPSLKACGLAYLALGWSGYMPEACHNTTLYLPLNMTWAAWGYPNRLQERFAKAGSYVYLIGPVKNDNGMPSINTAKDFAKVPKSWRMGVATDAIEVIGPLAKPPAPG